MRLPWGPRIESAEIKGDSILAHFDHCDEGLKTPRNRPATWVEIAGDDGVYHAALARVTNANTVTRYKETEIYTYFVARNGSLKSYQLGRTSS